MPHRTLLVLTLALGLLHACSNENPAVKPSSKMPDEITDNTANSKPAPKTVTDQDNDKTASVGPLIGKLEKRLTNLKKRQKSRGKKAVLRRQARHTHYVSDVDQMRIQRVVQAHLRGRTV